MGAVVELPLAAAPVAEQAQVEHLPWGLQADAFIKQLERALKLPPASTSH